MDLGDGWHTCHFCGEEVKDGLDRKGYRHWLSDCRPDLVEHEPGPTCTWHNLDTIPEGRNCYAYSVSNFEPSEPGTVGNGLKWTDEHKHFYTDGPM